MIDGNINPCNEFTKALAPLLPQNKMEGVTLGLCCGILPFSGSAALATGVCYLGMKCIGKCRDGNDVDRENVVGVFKTCLGLEQAPAALPETCLIFGNPGQKVKCEAFFRRLHLVLWLCNARQLLRLKVSGLEIIKSCAPIILILFPTLVIVENTVEVASLARKMYPGIFSTKLEMMKPVPLETRMETKPASISQVQGVTSLEGGNVIFFSRGGIQMALVGIGSIFLSMVIMRDNGFLSVKKIEIHQKKMFPFLEMPEQKFIEAAFQLSFSEIISFEDRQLSPKDLIIKKARLIAAEYDLVIEKIAKELMLPRENIVFVLHNEFHIDLEMLVLADGTVIHHDPDSAIQSLTGFKTYLDSSKYSLQSSREYLEKELEAQKKFKTPSVYDGKKEVFKESVYEYNKKVFEEKGISCIGVAGLYLVKEQSWQGETLLGGGQCLNGLLVEDEQAGKSYLLSTALNSTKRDENIVVRGIPEAHQLAENFYDFMLEKKITPIFIDCGGVGHGGVRCLSREQRRSLPVDIPQSIPVRAHLMSQRILTYIQLDYSKQVQMSAKYRFSAFVVPEELSNEVFLQSDYKSLVASSSSQQFIDGRPAVGHSYLFTILAPIEPIFRGLRLEIVLFKRQEIVWREGEVRRVLPGHPQLIDVQGVPFGFHKESASASSSSSSSSAAAAAYP